MSVRRIIHRRNPYEASRDADAEGRRLRLEDPERMAYFAEREVLRDDGTFPFGEGFLYCEEPRRRQHDAWPKGSGGPGQVFVFGHRGTKRQQQDAFGAAGFEVSGHPMAVVGVADGVSASGSLAKRAAQTAMEVFLLQARAELVEVPEHEGPRHAFLERAMTRAVFAANFEVVRQVLFDLRDKGAFEAHNRAHLFNEAGVHMTTDTMTPAEMAAKAPELEQLIGTLAKEDRHALTTFAAALACDNDLYCFTTGDAVVGLYRPKEPAGERYLHLTHRDQMVVELFQRASQEVDLDEHEDVYENLITDSLGDSAVLTGTLRRYPNLLEEGDRVVVHSDGLGPRGGGRGLDRRGVERALERVGPKDNPAQILVRAQLEDLVPGEYQDNLGVAVLTVVERSRR
jgi:serine/threonine protein phosphatase PrpC